MTDPAGPEGPGLDLQRRRLIRRVALVGSLGVGGSLSLVSGLLGGSGALGVVVLLLVSALSCGLAALVGAGTAIVDDLRGRTVSRRRVALTVALFFVAAMLMAMVAGIGG